MNPFSKIDDDLLTARYLALLPQTPLIVIAIFGGMVAQIIAFKDTVPFVWSVLPPMIILASGIYVFIYWLKFRFRKVRIAAIRRDMAFLSGVLIAAAIIAAIADFKIMEATTETGRYFLIMKLTFYGLFIQGLVFNIGRVSFLFALIICSAAVFSALYFHVDYAFPLAFMIIVFTIGLLTSAQKHMSRFDSFVFARAEALTLSEENARLARIDMLTNLPNRRQFFAVVGQHLESAMAAGEKLAVGILDLDGFKPVNDSYGHFVGDRVLAEVARRLMQDLPDPIAFYRLGGDEFAFHFITDGREEALRAIGRGIIKVVGKPMEIGDLVIRVCGSIGIAVSPDMARTTESLFEYADFALYHAKRTGRAHTEIFSPAHKEALRAQGLIEQALRVADVETEFFPMFQPIVQSDTGEAYAFEVLCRWQSPLLGLVPPGEFVPVAERAGLISNITLTLLRRCIEVVRGWPEDLCLAFNLSAYDIINNRTVSRVIKQVAGSGVNPSRFIFEITETALLQDFGTARSNIDLLRQAGVRMALDDFGTGYSSLSHVQSLSLDKLKIDRRFVMDIDTNPTSKMIVRSLVALCHGVGIGCVAEGAETASQVETLRALGCTNIQGYYYAKPMREDAISTFLACQSNK